MSTTSSNPVATFSNNLGYDVDIYDVYNTSSNPQGLLTYTKLATVPNGAANQQVPTIRFASQLQAMRTGSIAALNGNYYEQFPVAVLAVSPFNDAADNSLMLTSALQQGMEASFKFIKYAQANPTSQLAKDFRTALGDATSQKTAVNKFFAGTGSFKQCTLSTWTAVLTWQAQFTSAWQGTYYLYSLGSGNSAGGGSPAGGSSSTGTAPALVATLAVMASAQASSATLTMAGTNGESTAVVMVGDGTMQEQNAGTGNLAVVLTPGWLNVAQTSQQNGKAVTNYLIGAAFTGTINGTQVAGNLNQLTIPSTSDTSSSANSRNQANGFSLSSLEGLVGMLTGIGMLYYMAKGHKQAETQKENDVQKDATSKADAQQKEKKVEQDYQANEVPQVNQQAKQVEADTVPKVQEAYKQVDQANDIQVKETAVQEQIEELKDVMEEQAPSQTTEDTAEDLLKAQDDLDTATDPATTDTDRDTAVTDATDTLTTTSSDLNTALQTEAGTLTQAEDQALTNTENVLNEEQAQAEATEKAQEDVQQQNDDNDPSDPVNEDTFDNPAPETTGAIEGV